MTNQLSPVEEAAGEAATLTAAKYSLPVKQVPKLASSALAPTEISSFPRPPYR
ncbi:hypothetical protein LINGRAHAP2_LOCUS36109, partial [Linum grandiflorum]